MESGSAGEERLSGSLRGRADECALLEGLIEDLRRGRSRSMILRGEAGIGKTALLEHLISSAGDSLVLRAVGVESEMELAYASLHQLCAPLLDRLGALPAPQRAALEVVFGLGEGAAPDRFLVGLGVLGLFSAAAEERPLLCVIDDAQWLDRASAMTLAFVSRRLLAERVAIVFASREAGEELEHVFELEVKGVSVGDARALLDSAARTRLDERVRDRIVAETRGNPLALLELPRGLTATELAGGFGLPQAQGLRGQIEQNFARRLVPLTRETRLLLLVAAAEPVGDPLLLWGAAERLGIRPVAAETDGLLSIGERVTFRHPLVRSAVYKTAAAEDRRAVHLALAEATDEDADPDRRAWHLAAAAPGPDEEVAIELERSAARAQARGGVAAAAAFLKRSTALSRDPVRRAERSLAAAQAHLQVGSFPEALRLLALAEAGPLNELQRARVELLRGQIEFASTGGGDAPRLLLAAASQLEALDPTLARETYLDAWGAAMLGGHAGGLLLPEVSRAALAAPQTGSPSRPSDLLLDGLSLLVTEGTAGVSKLSQAVKLFASGEIAMAEALRWAYLASTAASALWDLESLHAMGDRLFQSAREAGLVFELQVPITALGMAATWRGEFPLAGSLAREADAVGEAAGTRFARYGALQLAGFRGNDAEASGLIEVETRNALAAGQGMGMTYCQWVSGVLYNGLGRYEQAVVESQRASEVRPELGLCAWARLELIEAASRTGQTQLAAETLERLTEAARIGETEWGLGVLARSRALLCQGVAAEASYREAIERLTRTRVRTELGRAHLLYGEWLRRENRRLDARAQLRTAYDSFITIGMEAFAERARGELHATGERTRKHDVQTRDDLTAQERQIAELARDGLTNPEIGARLFLSPRTVEWHLRHVFGKLSVKSRRELAKVLPQADSALA